MNRIKLVVACLEGSLVGVPSGCHSDLKQVNKKYSKLFTCSLVILHFSI